MTERTTKTMLENAAREIVDTIVRKNRDYGDAYAQLGLQGTFLPIHGTYWRLRRLMKAVLYARNSKPPKGWKGSDSDRDEAPGSWKTQLASLRAWAAREGHEVVLEEHDMASGRDPHRPGWERIVAEARGHHAALVAATKLDRVMRSTQHFLQVTEEFLALGL